MRRRSRRRTVSLAYMPWSLAATSVSPEADPLDLNAPLPILQNLTKRLVPWYPWRPTKQSAGETCVANGAMNVRRPQPIGIDLNFRSHTRLVQ